MPTRAPRHCTAPGCAHQTTTGQCPRHGDPRPSAHVRGYDTEWNRTSRRYRKTHPTCENPHCHQPSEHVDHIDGDNTNHNPTNLQALCHPCHSRKTVLHDGGFGRPRS